MAKKHIIKVNLRGGIISSGELGQIVEALKGSATNEIELGERQNIWFTINKKNRATLERHLKDSTLDYEIDSNIYPNVVSSYAAEDIFSSHPWISEGMYRDILNSFDYRPKIKINLVDNTQALAPLFTGVLNFIPSNHVNFYYVYVNHPLAGGIQCWNRLIYCNDIAGLSRIIEKHIKLKQKIALSTFPENIGRFVTMEMKDPLVLPRLRFPYYEGLNKMGDKFWLGIYRRSNNFSVDLLESIYRLCNKTRIGQVNITSWKSILIKGILEEDRIEWEKLLSQHGINSRHSSIELNWQFPDRDKEALLIKNELVKDFDGLDIRTYGLTFAVDTGKEFDISASVKIIKKEGAFPFWKFFKPLTTFDIYYAPDFSPNSTVYIHFAKNIPWNGVSIYLRNLSKRFYKQLSEKQTERKEPLQEEKKVAIQAFHQCKHCMTIYDEKIGDPGNGIEPGTSFHDLPENFVCPLCDNPKSDFTKKGAGIYVS